jgi:glucokinase
MILAGDVGGTKTRLALYDEQGGRLEQKDSATFGSQTLGSLDEALRTFLRERKTVVQRVCMGVPGPVIHGEARATNLPWTSR